MKRKFSKSNKKYNIKLYLLYKSIGADLIFYYIIQYIFYEQCKGFNTSQILFIDALYPICTILLNIPATIIVKRIGKKTGMTLGNILMIISLLITMASRNIIDVIVANAIIAFGICLKRLTESNLFAEIVGIKTKREKKIYSSIESKISRNYYLIDGVTSCFAGMTYVINPYLPIIISIAFLVVATVLSMLFKIPKERKHKRTLRFIREYGREHRKLYKNFKMILKSKRIKAILLFVIFFDGTLYTLYTLRASLLLDSIGMRTEHYTILIAILTVIAGLSSRLQQKINDYFKNKTLSVLAFLIVLSLIIPGVLSILNINVWIIIAISSLMFATQYGVQGTYEVLMSLYIRNFTSEDIRIDVSSVYETFHNISKFIMSIASSILLAFYTIEYNFVILGVVLGIIFFIVLNIMKKNFGLSPEEYDKKDIFEDYSVKVVENMKNI